VEALRRARDIGRAAGLHYVYEGNVPGESSESTRCHGCETLLIERYGHHLLSNRIRHDRCPQCGVGIPGVGMSGA
jgi:pyruvate formate lyase activating enzyme